jgi:hypothetical protein
LLQPGNLCLDTRELLIRVSDLFISMREPLVRTRDQLRVLRGKSIAGIASVDWVEGRHGIHERPPASFAVNWTGDRRIADTPYRRFGQSKAEEWKV